MTSFLLGPVWIAAINKLVHRPPGTSGRGNAALMVVGLEGIWPDGGKGVGSFPICWVRQKPGLKAEANPRALVNVALLYHMLDVAAYICSFVSSNDPKDSKRCLLTIHVLRERHSS